MFPTQIFYGYVQWFCCSETMQFITYPKRNSVEIVEIIERKKNAVGFHQEILFSFSRHWNNISQQRDATHNPGILDRSLK